MNLRLAALLITLAGCSSSIDPAESEPEPEVPTCPADAPCAAVCVTADGPVAVCALARTDEVIGVTWQNAEGDADTCGLHTVIQTAIGDASGRPGACLTGTPCEVVLGDRTTVAGTCD
jgi:hypothetical protein